MAALVLAEARVRERDESKSLQSATLPTIGGSRPAPDGYVRYIEIPLRERDAALAKKRLHVRGRELGHRGRPMGRRGGWRLLERYTRRGSRLGRRRGRSSGGVVKIISSRRDAPATGVYCARGVYSAKELDTARLLRRGEGGITRTGWLEETRNSVTPFPIDRLPLSFSLPLTLSLSLSLCARPAV